MAKRLVVDGSHEIQWLEFEPKESSEDEVQISPEFGVEKHGTMAAFVKGYGNDRGSWDSQSLLYREGGVLWNYPVPLGNMQFGTLASGERVAWWGAFEDVATVKRASLLNLGEVDWQDAAMQDPGEFALAALRDGGFRIGDRVAVFGLGAIGLAVVQLAVASGARQVFAIDPIATRRNVASDFGAEVLDPAQTDIGLALKDLTRSLGVDLVVDYSGSHRALQAGFRGLAFGGTLAYGAFPAPFPAGLDLGAEAHMNRAKVVFTRSCSDPNTDYPRWNENRIRETVWDLILNGKLKGSRIVDNPIPFDRLKAEYPLIAAQPESHLKMSVVYPR